MSFTSSPFRREVAFQIPDAPLSHKLSCLGAALEAVKEAHRDTMPVKCWAAISRTEEALAEATLNAGDSGVPKFNPKKFNSPEAIAARAAEVAAFHATLKWRPMTEVPTGAEVVVRMRDGRVVGGLLHPDGRWFHSSHEAWGEPVEWAFLPATPKY